MKTLIAYYSRTGTTKKVAENLAARLDADLEEIRDTADRSGIKGYLRSGRDAMKKNLTKLEPAGRNASEYDLVIVGTPIWAWNVSAPTRTYLEENKSKLKQAAFFCTMGGSGDQQAFAEMERISGQKPAGTLALKTVEVTKDMAEEKITDFVKMIKGD